jgi:hypothetical protein
MMFTIGHSTNKIAFSRGRVVFARALFIVVRPKYAQVLSEC